MDDFPEKPKYQLVELLELVKEMGKTSPHATEVWKEIDGRLKDYRLAIKFLKTERSSVVNDVRFISLIWFIGDD